MQSLTNTLADLVRINSVNSFYEGGPGEAELADYVEAFFSRRGIETWRQTVFAADPKTKERTNVIARLPGRDSSRRIVLEAHMDTVTVDGMSISPFEPRIEHGLMYGRGSCDTKGGLAAMMHAIADLHSGDFLPACDVWLAAVVDEEFSFRGVLKLCEGLHAEAAVVAEPTELRLVVASKGVLRWRMIAHGKAAHSSKTNLGTNAIYHMARVALALEQDHANLSKYAHPLLGTPSCNVGKIHGGVQVNFVPDQCVIEIDRRLLPHESVSEVWSHYENLLRELKETLPAFDVRMENPMIVDEAWTTDVSEKVVQVAAKVLKGLDRNAEPSGVPFGSDASKFARAGIPSILFGPGSIDQAHTANEYVELAQVERAFEFYRSFIRNYT